MLTATRALIRRPLLGFFQHCEFVCLASLDSAHASRLSIRDLEDWICFIKVLLDKKIDGPLGDLAVVRHEISLIRGLLESAGGGLDVRLTKTLRYVVASLDAKGRALSAAFLRRWQTIYAVTNGQSCETYEILPANILNCLSFTTARWALSEA